MKPLSDAGFAKIFSISGPIGTPLVRSINWEFAHSFVGVDFFTDEALTNAIEPTTGTVAITVKSVTCDLEQAVVNSPITASSREVLSFAGNTVSVTATPTGISAGTNYYRLRVATNRS